MGTISKRLELLFVMAFLCHVPAQQSAADEVKYLYDQTGRLDRVLKGNEALKYQYDEVGNLLAITKGTVSTGAPSIQSITPNVLFIGQTLYVTITGQNLFTTQSVTPSDTSNMSVKVLDVTDSAIKTEITVLSSAQAGTQSLTVTTLYGSANGNITLSSSQLSFSPAQQSLAPGSSGNISVTITPGLATDVVLNLKNSDSTIASVPATVTVPSSGTQSFTVNALQNGTATISAGGPHSIVSVATFAVDPGETITNFTGPISVLVEGPAGNSTAASRGVSVYIESSFGNSIVQSSSVSVYIEAALGNSAVYAVPVSVEIEEPPPP